jgi:hypothetical protein
MSEITEAFPKLVRVLRNAQYPKNNKMYGKEA